MDGGLDKSDEIDSRLFSDHVFLTSGVLRVFLAERIGMDSSRKTTISPHSYI